MIEQGVDVSKPAAHPPRVRGIFWRLYLFSIGLVVLVTVAALGVAEFTRRAAPPFALALEFAESLEARMPQVLDDPSALASELVRESERTGGEIAVYRTDGDLVATSGDPPIPRLEADQLQRLTRGPIRYHFVIGEAGLHGLREWDAPEPRPPQWFGLRGTFRRWHLGLSVPLPADKPVAYVSMGIPVLAPSVMRLLAVLGVVLGVLAIATIPFARNVAVPMMRLSRTATVFGHGDLSVRSGIRRRDEIGVLAGAFDDMADRIERLVRGEKELLANVSHELRTPLARIRVALELAAEGDASSAKRALTDVRSDLGELELLVNDIMTAARLDLAQGKPRDGLPLRRERLEPEELLARCADRFREAHPLRKLDVSVEPNLPALDGDPVLLRRVIDNVIDNARKYSDEGQPILLSAKSEGHSIKVEVQDRGIGIDPADLPLVFTPFFRTDRSRARGSGGVGLGLALAKRITEAHGGSIQARSSPGQGTSIQISLPTPQ